MTTINAVGNGLSGASGSGSFVGATSPTISQPIFSASGGSTIMQIIGTAAVNYWKMTGNSTGNAPTFTVGGSDANVGLQFGAQAAGTFQYVTTATTNQVTYSCNSKVTTLSFTASTARIVTFPDAAGTVTLLGNTSTGSGSVVLATSPTLVTPILGAATATSINFGGSTLSTFTDKISWTPVVTFATPGDLGVVYPVQKGSYSRTGNMITVCFNLGFTPTFTTASGALQITGLPFACSASVNQTFVGSILDNGLVYPAGTTSLFCNVVGGASLISVGASGTATNATNFSTASVVSATTYFIYGTLTYFI